MTSSNRLLEQKLALGAYLDDMLHEATKPEIASENGAAETIGGDLLTAKIRADIQPSDDDEVNRPHPPLLEAALELSSNDTETATPTLRGSTPQAPVLSGENFPLQSLMFKVGNNRLAIPLTELHSVVEWPGKLTCLPGEPDWMLGILKYRDSNVRVVDSAAVLQVKRDAHVNARFILVLGDEQWGIICDQIDTVVSLNFDDIHWHRNQGNNLTYGTVRDSLASFLNPCALIRHLQPKQIAANEKTT